MKSQLWHHRIKFLTDSFNDVQIIRSIETSQSMKDHKTSLMAQSLGKKKRIRIIVKFTEYCQQNHLYYIVSILYISQILLRGNIRTQNSDFQIYIQYTTHSWEETRASFLNLCIPRTQQRYCWLSCADALEERTASAQESVSGKHICYREGQDESYPEQTTTKKDPRWTRSQNKADVYRFKMVNVTQESISVAKKYFSSSRSHLSLTPRPAGFNLPISTVTTLWNGGLAREQVGGHQQTPNMRQSFY